MSGLKNLLVGVIVLFIENSCCYGGATFYLTGNPFDPIARSFLLSLEKEDNKINYQFVDKLDGYYGFDVANRVIYLNGQTISLKYNVRDVLDRYLVERSEGLLNSYFIIIQNELIDYSGIADTFNNKKVQFSLVSNKKDVDLVINKKKNEIGKKRVIFLVIGGENTIYKDLVIPMFYRRTLKNMDIVVIAEHLCGKIMEKDNMVGLKGVEFYSFISCVGDEEVKEFAEKVDNEYFSAIIGLESFYLYKNAVEGNHFSGRFMEKTGYNEYSFTLNGYVVMGDGSLKLIPIVRQIELK